MHRNHDEKLFERVEEAKKREKNNIRDIRSFNETYKEIALNCFRYLDFKIFDRVDLLSFAEYELLVKQ